MALYGIDFSFGNGLTTEQVSAGGKHFVCRYLSGGNSKDISAAELDNYKKAGIGVVFVWETTGTDMTSEQAGINDAHGAQAELDRLGASDAVVFFAADEQTEPAEAPYLAGTESVVGKSRNGIYGGLGSIENGFNSGHVSFGWQTYAWSNSAWDDRALLRQYQNNVKFGPATVDLDEAAYWNSTKVLTMADDFGQWPRPASKPAPQPTGPFRQVIAKGNTYSFSWYAAYKRHESASALLSFNEGLVPNTLGQSHYNLLAALFAADEAAGTVGADKPAMGADTVLYTKNE